MSKAFTRESDDVNADEVASVRPHFSAGSKNYITKEGAVRLGERLSDLLAEKRVLAGKGDEGSIDNVLFYNRALSAFEVNLLYHDKTP